MDSKNKKDGVYNYAPTTTFKNIKSYTEMYDAESTDSAINAALTDYYTKSQIDETLGDYYTKSDIDDNFYTKDEVDAKVASVYHFKGSVDTYVELKELTGMEVGDVYNVVDTGKNYAWTGVTSAYDEGWDTLGGTFDLNNYYTKNEADALLSAKVDNEDLDAYYTKTEADALLSAKVDKVDGMGLSHNDFTDAYVAKVDDALLKSTGGAASGTISVIAGNDMGKRMEVVGDYGTAALSTTGISISNNTGTANLGLTPTAIEYVNAQGYHSLPVADIATNSAIASATSAKADSSEFNGLTALELIDTDDFDVEEVALKYNTLVTVLSGIALALNA